MHFIVVRNICICSFYAFLVASLELAAIFHSQYWLMYFSATSCLTLRRLNLVKAPD